MSKTTIDQLLAAIEAVQLLEQTVNRHDQAIEKIVDRLEAIQQRLDRLEADSRK